MVPECLMSNNASQNNFFCEFWNANGIGLKTAETNVVLVAIENQILHSPATVSTVSVELSIIRCCSPHQVTNPQNPCDKYGATTRAIWGFDS